VLDDLVEDADAVDSVEGSLTAIPVATLRAFLAVAALSQVGLFAVSLGAMLAGFRGQWALGGAVAAVGAVALAGAAATYARYAP